MQHALHHRAKKRFIQPDFYHQRPAIYPRVAGAAIQLGNRTLGDRCRIYYRLRRQKKEDRFDLPEMQV